MLFNFFIGGLIGLIYYLIICQISHNITIPNNIISMQKSIMFLYFGGLIGLFIGSLMKLNSSLKIGLYFGSSLLIFNSMIINWENMSDETKLLLLGINFGLIIWYSYYAIQSNKKSKKSKKSKKIKESN